MVENKEERQKGITIGRNDQEERWYGWLWRFEDFGIRQFFLLSWFTRKINLMYCDNVNVSNHRHV